MALSPLAGALVAAGVGWLSVVAVVFAPRVAIPTQPIRVIGGITIVMLALMVLGVPMPSYVPLVFLMAGVLGVYLTAKGAS